MTSSGYLQFINYSNTKFVNLTAGGSKYKLLDISYVPLQQWTIHIYDSTKCYITTLDNAYILDIYDVNKPHLLAYRSSHQVNANQLFTYTYRHNNIRIQTYNKTRIGLANLLYVDLKVVKVNTIQTIMSFNLGFSVMANSLTGSERPLVEKCQRKYSGGWLHTNKLSQCSANVADLINQLHVDIVGWQEVHSTYWPQFKAYLQARTNIQYEYFMGGLGIVIASNIHTLGHGVQITPKYFTIGHEDKRGMMAVFYSVRGWLVVNMHVPHYIDVITTVNRKMKQIEQLFISLGYVQSQVKRIIILGDFNDDQRHVNRGNYISAFDKRIELPHYPIPKTCCTDSDYMYTGDYIMDSSTNKHTYFGLPPSYVRYKPLMSDHEPIILVTHV